MSKFTKGKNYKSPLNIYETQTAIGILKRSFEDNLSAALNLKRVSAPLFVEPNTGLNDDLNGVERPVSFDIAETGKTAQVVHSLAKWKRMALHLYSFPVGEGLYTDMNAIRRDEEMDNLHSIYVDQWDWERVIENKDRSLDYLKDTVREIVSAMCKTQATLKANFPALRSKFEEEVSFITSQELEDLYPSLTSKERENEYTKKHRTVFIMQIGGALKSGNKHDGRAPDYDDWSLNGDLLLYSDILGCAVELSSMGIRVDERALDKQLSISNNDSKRTLTYHKALLEGKLPLTIGGGIGQSRLSMLLLEKLHVGEVQVSVWDDETVSQCKDAGIKIL